MVARSKADWAERNLDRHLPGLSTGMQSRIKFTVPSNIAIRELPRPISTTADTEAGGHDDHASSSLLIKPLTYYVGWSQ